MSETLFAILTDTSKRQATAVQEDLADRLSVGAPWF